MDCCLRYLRIPYDEYSRFPRAVKILYRYYFMMRGWHEEQLEETRKREEKRLRSEAETKARTQRQTIR
tara:strand:+ start:3623 stop:3826 length:204 start_codon:yes stop_codon:yes gene_type:complete